ncbi:MAG: hypothetical protein QOH69_2144 [Actinomycetota bacterium]|nr:hypothetical protein [Actinomycetota bacterium]
MSQSTAEQKRAKSSLSSSMRVRASFRIASLRDGWAAVVASHRARRTLHRAKRCDHSADLPAQSAMASTPCNLHRLGTSCTPTFAQRRCSHSTEAPDLGLRQEWAQSIAALESRSTIDSVGGCSDTASVAIGSADAAHVAKSRAYRCAATAFTAEGVVIDFVVFKVVAVRPEEPVRWEPR